MSWPTVLLSELGHISAGGTPSRSKQEYWGEGVKWLSIKDYKDFDSVSITKEQITQEGLENSSAKLLPKGTVIISIFATLGRVAILDDEMATNQAIAGIQCNGKVDEAYLMYALKSKLADIENQAGGVAQKNINLSILKGIEIPLPPLPVQKQIAAVLEKADTLRSQCQQMEQELNSLAQSVFLDMFGKGYSATELGKHIDFVTSGSRGWAKYYSESGARFIRTLDVQMNYIGSKDIAYVNAPKGKEADRAKVQHGDVLLTITGSRIGRVCWVTKDIEEAYISQHVALLRLKKSILPEFLSYFLSMPNLGQRQIEKAQYGQTKPGLNLAQIRTFTIPEVSMNEQIKFLQIISSYKTFSEVKFQYEGQLNNLFNSLMQRAFKGELDLKDVA